MAMCRDGVLSNCPKRRNPSFIANDRPGGITYTWSACTGKSSDTSSTGIRSYLQRSDEALAVIAKAKLSGDAAQTFLDVVRQDAAKAGAAIRLVLAQPAIGSQIIDNLNASIHLRALLTDLFLLDETLKLTGS